MSKERIDHLIFLIETTELSKNSLAITHSVIAKNLLELEDELSENREYLETLNDRRIISKDDYGNYIEICFDVFRENVINRYGEALYKRLYQ